MIDDAVIRFVEARIDQMIERPALWGTLESVEEQLLQLLELRRVVANPPGDPRSNTHTRALMAEYNRFSAAVVPGNESLTARLTRLGRGSEVATRLREFVDEERRRVVIPHRPRLRSNQVISFDKDAA